MAEGRPLTAGEAAPTTRSMRILHLLHQYLPEHVGGVELNVQAISTAMAAQGIPTALFFRGSGEGAGLDRAEARGVVAYRAWDGAMTPTRRFAATFHSPALLDAFRQTLDEFQPQVVHLHHLMGLPAALGEELIRRDIPFLVTLHDYWWPCANAQLLTNDSEQLCAGPRAWINCGRCALARAGARGPALWAAPAVAPLFALRHRRLGHILDRAALLTAPTHFTAETYAALGYDTARLAVVPYGIVPPSPPPPRRPHEAGRLRVAYVGGIAPQKGVHTLVEAARPLLDEGLTLDIWGDLAAFPDYAASLRAAAAPSITFHGRADNRAILQAMADAEVLVVPSLWYETAAIVIQEAFAVGTPVIASDLGALRERVRDGVDGLRFPPGDAAALSARLRALLDAPEQLDRFRAAIRPVHTLDEQVAAFLAHYRRLLPA